MRPTSKILAALLAGVFVSIVAGCQKSAAPFQPTAALTPTPVPSPQPSDIQLSFPQTITLDDVFVVSVTNEGTVSYAYYVQHPADNCLVILDATGEFMPTIPDETCDALAENIIAPGQSRLFSSWDLKGCVDSDCLRREFVAPGRYHFSATFYPDLGDGTFTGENSFTFEESFMLLSPSS
jgi:hypothetical protein